MAGFKTHITASSVLGIGYAAVGHSMLGAPLSASVLAGGLCSLSGMLPDLDSDSGVPIRESTAFAAAVVPMLMIDRFQHLGMSVESMVLAGAGIYLLIRFGVAGLLRRYTVHRGMWHSLPAAAIVGLLAFLICSCQDPMLRSFKAGSVVLGYVSHLLLDELYSVDLSRGRVKRSFGSALKFWSNNSRANVWTYAALGLVLFLAVGDTLMMEHFRFHEDHVHQWVRHVYDRVVREVGALSH